MRLPEVTKVNRRLMRKLAQDALDKILLDLSGGKFQDGSGPKPYPDSPYKSYKSTGMQRKRGGGRLKGFKGKALNTDTDFVNLHLTKATIRGIRAGAKKDTAVITYDNGQVVLGQKANGYNIYDLSDDNLNFIAERFGKELLDKNIAKYVSRTNKTI